MYTIACEIYCKGKERRLAVDAQLYIQISTSRNIIVIQDELFWFFHITKPSPQVMRILRILGKPEKVLVIAKLARNGGIRLRHSARDLTIYLFRKRYYRCHNPFESKVFI